MIRWFLLAKIKAYDAEFPYKHYVKYRHMLERQNTVTHIYLITGGHLFNLGGTSKYIVELAQYLIHNGFNVTSICRFGKILHVNSSLNMNYKNEKAYNSNRVHTLYVLLQHLPNPLTVIFGTIRLIIDIRHRGSTQKILHAHDTSCSLLIAFFINKIFNIPFIVQVHGFPIREQKIKVVKSHHILKNFIWFLTWIWHIIAIKMMAFNSAYVIVNNSEVKSFYESMGVPQDKIKIIPSAIDLKKHEKCLLSKIDAERNLGIPDGFEYITFGYVGGLRPEKNVLTLLKSLNELLKSSHKIKARILILGNGPEKTFLKETAIKLGISHYTYFLGHVPEAFRFLNAIDVFVLPSLSEGSPIALLEAMIAGKAIIASDISAIREIIENGKEGLLFKPHDAQQLANQILTLYNNSELRKELGENAKRKARQYDVNIIFAKITQIYHEILRNKP